MAQDQTKELLVKLEEWRVADRQIGDLSDSVAVLSTTNPQSHSWGINFLVGDLVRVAEERQDALRALKEFGIETHEDALALTAKLF